MNHLRVVKTCLILFIVVTAYLLMGCSSRYVTIDQINQDVADYLDVPVQPVTLVSFTDEDHCKGAIACHWVGTDLIFVKEGHETREVGYHECVHRNGVLDEKEAQKIADWFN